MTGNNRTLIQKAEMTISQLTTNGGYLVPAQAQRFIRILIDESVVMPMATVVPMRSHTQLIEKIRFENRILRAASECQALSEADRARPDTSKEELKAQLFKAEVRLCEEVLEDNIERGSLRETVMAIMAERISLDMDEIIVNGDTTSTDPFLAKFDGILKQASVNTVSNLSNPLSRSHLKDLLKTMPTEFLRNKRLLRTFTSVDAELDYRDTLASRETQGGDRWLENDVPVAYGGVPIIPVPVFPENLGAGTDETNTLTTDPKNIHVGIWRRLKIETDKDITSGELIIVASLRFDTRFAEPRATVKGTAVKVT